MEKLNKRFLKLYILDGDDSCHTLHDYLVDAKSDGLSTIDLSEAVLDKDRNKTMVWCSEYGYAREKYECNAKECNFYHRSNNGNRFCDFRGKLYTKGKDITFDVNTGNKIKDERNTV